MDFTSFSAIATGIIMIVFYIAKSGLKESTWDRFKGWIPAIASVLGVVLGVIYALQNNLQVFDLRLLYESAKIGLAAVGIDQLVKRTSEKVIPDDEI